jgi:exodeoxyribonuclease V alpha subunit
MTVSNEEKLEYAAVDKSLADFFCSILVGVSENNINKINDIICQLSSGINNGHTCIYLLGEQVKLLIASGLASDGQVIKPFVIDNKQLYFYRYWKYEVNITRLIKHLLNTKLEPAEEEINRILYQLFPLGKIDTSVDGVDWQRSAVENSIKHNFSIITGGPGTGKTTTVIKLLGALIALAGSENIHIALAAPTGKASSRLQASIVGSKSWLKKELGNTLEKIPEKVSTIHGLLQPKYFSPYFKYNHTNCLPYDVVVIDEASMIDVALMSKLLQALKPSARIILLGDKHQLSSVEVGSVLSDLTIALPQYTYELKKTYRFGGAIKDLALAVNAQKNDLAFEVLTSKDNTVSLLPHGVNALMFIVSKYIEYIQVVRKNLSNVDNAFQAFNHFQVLCSNNIGRYGVEGINYQVENGLAYHKLISNSNTWYAGKPIMISQNVNSSNLNLSNGDIGICLPNSDDKLQIYFEDGKGGYKKYSPSKLPQYTTAYAMSIHKSQGSEFLDVLIALPEKPNQIMTKELLYTAITRAKKSVRIVGSVELLGVMIKQRVKRDGGLIKHIEESEL